MKWSDLITMLPPKHCEERENKFLRELASGSFLKIKWSAISCVIGTHLGILYVAADAIRIGEEGDSCRATFTHRGAQRAVDMLGLALPTDKIADLIHQQASIIVAPQTDGAAMNRGQGTHTSVMERHSRKVDLVIGQKVKALTSTVGKHWITHDKLRKRPKWGVNYGWHSIKAPNVGRGGLNMWQTVGTRHNWDHVDYSQVLVPVNRVMLINGEEMLLEEVMAHPQLSELVSYDGPMSVTRHPDVLEPSGGVKILRI